MGERFRQLLGGRHPNLPLPFHGQILSPLTLFGATLAAVAGKPFELGFDSLRLEPPEAAPRQVVQQLPEVAGIPGRDP